MSISLGYPLLVLIIALPVLGIHAYLTRRSLSALSGPRLIIISALRLAIIMLLIFALSELKSVRHSDRQCHIFALDMSDSVPDSARAEAMKFISEFVKQLDPKDKWGMIAFGREAFVEKPAGKGNFSPELGSTVDRSHTNIAGAIRLAGAMFPEGYSRNLVLMTDGNETIGSALSEVLSAIEGDVQIHVFPLEGVGGDDIMVEKLESPQEVMKHETFNLKVVLSASKSATAELNIYASEKFIGSKKVFIEAEKKNIYLLPQRLEESGLVEFRAEVRLISGSDSAPANNVARSYTFISGKPKALLVTGAADGPNSALKQALNASGITIEMTGADNFPISLDMLADYHAIVLDNVEATEMSDKKMSLIGRYVRDMGGGFIFVGGPDSYGPGGYFGTEMEEILPVYMDIRRKKYFPDMSMVLAIDKSGSMAAGQIGLSKMELAKEAAIVTVDLLTSEDSIGVIAFDGAAKVIWDLSKLTDKASVKSKIATLRGGGGTSMYPAYRMALEWLKESRSQIKHIILLTDGRSEPGDFMGITREARKLRITVTTVAIGVDADYVLLSKIAKEGKGRYYSTDQIANLPKIFTKEAFLASAAAVVEEKFTPKLKMSLGPTEGFSMGQFPALYGYVGTYPKPLTRTLLSSHRGDPIAAIGQTGLGNVMAFTSDARGRWAKDWIGWEGFGQFWTQSLRWAMRPPVSQELRVNVSTDNKGVGKISVDAISREGERFMNALDLVAHATGPGDEQITISLVQTAPGRYEGSFSSMKPGGYIFTVAEIGGAGGVKMINTVGFDLRQMDEYSGPLVNMDLLERIASRGKGKIIRNKYAPPRVRIRIYGEMLDRLLKLAVILFLIEVVMRRVSIGRDQLAWVSDRIKARPRLSTGVSETAYIDTLKRAKERFPRRELWDDAKEPDILKGKDETIPPPEVSVIAPEDDQVRKSEPQEEKETPQSTMDRLRKVKDKKDN